MGFFFISTKENTKKAVKPDGLTAFLLLEVYFDVYIKF